MKTTLIFLTTTSLLPALFVAGFVTLSSNIAKADRIPTEARPWAAEVRLASRSGQVQLGPVDLATNAIPPDVRTQLGKIADEQAQIWADTILEGDYVAENAVNVDTVETVQVNTVFLGYRITYSSVAFDTSDCDARANIAACRRGKIVESTFVAPTLDTWVRDEKHMAEFVED